MSGEKRGILRYTVDVLPSLLVVAGAIMISYANMTMAQKDIKDLKDQEVKHEEILNQIPSMATDIEHMERSLVSISAALIEINKTLKIEAVEDAKYHHEHN